MEWGTYGDRGLDHGIHNEVVRVGVTENARGCGPEEEEARGSGPAEADSQTPSPAWMLLPVEARPA